MSPVFATYILFQPLRRQGWTSDMACAIERDTSAVEVIEAQFVVKDQQKGEHAQRQSAIYCNGAIQVADCASFLAARVRKIQGGLVKRGVAAEAIEGLWERRVEPFIYANEVWAPVWGSK